MTLSSPASRIQANVKDLFKATLPSGDTYIKFKLTPNMTALMSMKQVQESSVVKADSISPLPNMPESIIGIINSRDRVFCVFDLAQLLINSSPLVLTQKYQIIVVDLSDSIANNPQKLYMGFAVESIQGIIRIDSSQINSASNDSLPSLASYIQGYVAKTPILDLGKITQAAATL